MPKKRLAVGLSAASNLRAELVRAREESSKHGEHRKRKKKQDIKRNRGVKERAQKDVMIMVREEDSRRNLTTSQARQVIEEKARLYDRLSNQCPDTNEFLMKDPRVARILEDGVVDFANKQQLGNSVQSKKVRHESSEMVEIVDEFGRTRTVSKRDVGRYCKESSPSTSSDSYSVTESDLDSTDKLRSLGKRIPIKKTKNKVST